MGAKQIVRTFVLFFALSGCITHVKQQCPSCVYTDGKDVTPRLRPGTERLFVLVPGALGYGWEWDAAVDALRHAHADFIVFWWDPWNSLHLGAQRLNDVLQTALWVAPSLKEIVVVAHSAGGIVGAHALAGLRVPPRSHVELVTIGTPFAGMGAAPVGEEYADPLGSPAVLSIGGRFHHYPDPPAGVSVLEYTTRWPPDPVMTPRYGWQPAPPDVGPRGARRVPVDPKLDHNFVVARVINDLLARDRATASSPADSAKAASDR
jgi:hypothetical protein